VQAAHEQVGLVMARGDCNDEAVLIHVQVLEIVIAEVEQWNRLERHPLAARASAPVAVSSR
jgi:putative NIF3 family GTP cyclohydrolase 1 type 2